MVSSRSLVATQRGLHAIRARLTDKNLTYDEFASFVEAGRSTVINFCSGKFVSRKNFVELCKWLDLDWREIAEVTTTEPEQPSFSISQNSNIDILVQKLRQQVRADIERRCGTMRVLDMTQPITTNSIYTAVNILEKVNSKTRAEIAELMQNCGADNFDRFTLGAVRQKRIDGLEAVAKKRLLMILGRPGAGKTTFLKRLAMFCTTGEQFPNQVPFFVSLKEFADFVPKSSLVQFIAEGQEKQVDACATILAVGRGLVLLDGLDEVTETEHDRVLREIRDFGRLYDSNQIIITCRIAAREYIFEQFTEVEVADFNEEQISDFVTKWFAEKDPKKAELFLGNIESNEPVKELATNPLLLTLLCLEFEGSGEFPKSRSELYKRGLDELLVKWDGRRNIRRDQVYRNLPTKRKVSLLGRLAMRTFAQGDYFFKRRTAENFISRYIENLPDAHTDPEALLVDSDAILNSIEAQHGLLTERAKGVYSFSHLTFHEYFAAVNILESSQCSTCVLNALAAHVGDKRWREVFLLVVEQLEPADYLLKKMKLEIDGMLAGDEKLQNYLTWTERKSRHVQFKYKLPALRAYYYSLALDRTIDLDRALALDLDRALALDLDRALALDLALDRVLDLDLDRAFALALEHAYALDHNLHAKLEKLRQELPKDLDENVWIEWWDANGETWTAKLRQVMITHRNIGHDWQFTEEQKQKLKLYYEANQLLVDCLNSECYVSRAAREEIEATLLLPVEAPIVDANL